MKRIFLAFSILLFSISLSFSANETSIDFGSMDGLVYSHAYFDMKITVPEKWQVQDREARQRLMQMGEQVVTGNDPNLKALVDASKLNTLNLLTVFRHTLGAAVDFNPSFLCVAEKVSHLPGIQKGSDYLFHTRKFLESAQVKYKFVGPNSEQTISGVPFDVMTTELAVKSIVVKQKFYSTIRKGYALNFILSYDTDETKQQLLDILNSVEFANY